MALPAVGEGLRLVMQPQVKRSAVKAAHEGMEKEKRKTRRRRVELLVV